jgi:hypothetical protein
VVGRNRDSNTPRPSRPHRIYKRHGTTTLFAALEVATGKIIAAHSKRRRRIEFLDFMDSVTSAFPDRQLHVILDNLNTHKKNEHWLTTHPNVKFHFTPTSASWLNQVEVWFSILQGQSLSGASFTSLKQLQEHIDAYINAYNEKAEPFVWTKKKVRQRRFKRPPYHSALIPGTSLIIRASCLRMRRSLQPARVNSVSIETFPERFASENIEMGRR